MLGFLLDGGWMMLPLVVCSVVGLAILIDRARAFRSAGTGHEDLRKQVRVLLDGKRFDEAVQLCAASSGPVAATLLAGLLRYRRMQAKGRRPEEMEIAVSKTMEEYAPKAMQGLEKRLSVMLLIASISPLLGMTGTVTGMIRSFDVMASSAGLEPGAVAGGIAEALITTAAGLLIAIPAVVAYNVFTRRVEDYTSSIESGIADLVEAISEA
jgi:biopolymer transport protein ExbB